MYSKSTVTHNIWKSWICTKVFQAVLPMWHIQCCMFKTEAVITIQHGFLARNTSASLYIWFFELISRHCVFRNLLLFPNFSKPPHSLTQLCMGSQPTVSRARPQMLLWNVLWHGCFKPMLFRRPAVHICRKRFPAPQHGQHPFWTSSVPHCKERKGIKLWEATLAICIKALKIRQLFLHETSLLEIHLC